VAGQGRAGHPAADRRHGALELPGHQPGGPQAGLRHRRAQRRQRAQQLPGRPVSNGGKPRQVDTTPFKLGENLAATKGKVVFRNSLMELLQYEPTTRTTYETPILCSPPWINKYYVMDLAPGRSFIQWAVDHGHTVFAISYRNPDKSMRGVKLDDYLLQGPVTALDVVRDITGAPQANVVGLCLGRHSDDHADRLPGRRSATSGSSRRPCSTP
jgi:hypothetical protein